MFATTEHNNVIKETNGEFMVRLTVDRFSKRIWVNEYAYRDPGELLGFINAAAKRHGLEKIIFPVRKKHLTDLNGKNFSPEGWIDGYFNGEDGCFLTAYPVPKRNESPVLQESLRQVKEITGRGRKLPAPVPPGHEIFTPGLKDIPALAVLFKQAFTSYPSPVDQPDYLAGMLGKTALFRAARCEGRIVSAAAAEVDQITGSAELTNCATLPGSRGGGLMSHIIIELEQDCLDRGINCLYSLARASSYGMNLVFHRLGYRYRGTLVNNCHICGDYENMNIWAKYVR